MEKLKDINWNHLYGFYEVAREQSLKSASRSLGLSPSTLSEQIKKLETSFSKKLFIRQSRGLTLTIDGKELYEHAKVIFEEGSKVLEKFSDDVMGGYPIQVGIEETISYDLAAEFTSQYWDFYALYGTVNTVRQSSHELLIDNLGLENIDWGISLRKPNSKRLSYQEIGSFEIVFCCSSKLYKKFKDPKDILVNIPFAQSSSDHTINDRIYNYLSSLGVSPKEKIQSDHPQLIHNLCKRGRCVMFIPKNPLKKYPGLKTFNLGTVLKVSLFAIWKKKNEDLISIMKLKDLINSKLSQVPDRYGDVDLQIEASDVSQDLLE